nr:hypothetical protein [Arthrobacter sedimenti]
MAEAREGRDLVALVGSTIRHSGRSRRSPSPTSPAALMSADAC